MQQIWLLVITEDMIIKYLGILKFFSHYLIIFVNKAIFLVIKP